MNVVFHTKTDSSDGGIWFSKVWWRIWRCDFTSYGYPMVWQGGWEGARRFVRLIPPFYFVLRTNSTRIQNEVD